MLVFSFITLEMGILKNGKAPKSYLSPYPLPSLHSPSPPKTHTPQTRSSDEKHCGASAGLPTPERNVVLRSGALHLYGLQCVCIIHSTTPPHRRPFLLVTFHYKRPLMDASKSSGCEVEYKINVSISGLCTPFMTVEEYTIHANHTVRWKSLQFICNNLHFKL